MIKKRYLYVTIALTLLTYFASNATIRNFYRKNKKFSLSSIRPTPPFYPNQTLPPLSTEQEKEVASAMDQNYTYLGRGGQCFAFLSEDGKYVLKLLNQKRKKDPFYISSLLSIFAKKSLQKKIDHRKKENLSRIASNEVDAKSYLMAIQELKELTGVLFIHLQMTSHLLKTLTVSDKSGKKHTLALDHYEFLIQRKAELIYDKITKWMQEGKQEKAQGLISNVIQAVITRSEQSIIDDDPRIDKNFGCIEERCLFIDVGRFRKHPQIADPSIYLQDLERITLPLKIWLSDKHPHLKIDLENKLIELKNLYHTNEDLL
ncbi:MAG: hypothetical protein NTZ52_02345 [Chlamydiae bacterium]|nr:hypothetical protein [Chlamydiota bacterium]